MSKFQNHGSIKENEMPSALALQCFSVPQSFYTKSQQWFSKKISNTRMHLIWIFDPIALQCLRLEFRCSWTYWVWVWLNLWMSYFMFIRVLIYTVLSGSINLWLTIRMRASHSQLDPVLLRETTRTQSYNRSSPGKVIKENLEEFPNQ